MTRKQRGETYNLSNARDRAAFEALMHDEDADVAQRQQQRGGAARVRRRGAAAGAWAG